MLDFILHVWKANQQREAIVWRERAYDYGSLLLSFEHWKEGLPKLGIAPETVVVLDADFSPNAVALFLALIDLRCFVVPLSEASRNNRDEFKKIAGAERAIMIDAQDEVTTAQLRGISDHPPYNELRARKHPGLVLFSSGSTGESKAAVHDVVPLLEKFK